MIEISFNKSYAIMDDRRPSGLISSRDKFMINPPSKIDVFNSSYLRLPQRLDYGLPFEKAKTTPVSICIILAKMESLPKSMEGVNCD